MKKFLEALMERGGSPADRESAAVIVAAARAFTARPFRWVREPRWWELAQRQRNYEKLVGEWKKKRAFEIRENERIKEMIGNGKFTYNKENHHLASLEVQAELQAHTPVEHDIFEAFVKHYSGTVSATVRLAIVQGSLVATFAIPAPALEGIPAPEHPENRTGIALKADRDAERAKAAEAKEKAEKAAADAQVEAAKVAAQAQELKNAELADIAAKAGAAAAQEVLKNLKEPAAPSV